MAYLFNIVNEPQITDLYFHNVLHCAACQLVRFFVCTSFSHFENLMTFILFHLKFIKFKPKIKFIRFELHNYVQQEPEPEDTLLPMHYGNCGTEMPITAGLT